MTARQSSTSSMGNMVVVNGPIRDEIGMNSGIGALGPYNHANATIGRAYGLALAEPPGRLGAGRSPTWARRATTSPTTACTFAENEERSPWAPFHVQHGFDPDESTVTVFYVWGSVWTEGLREHWAGEARRRCSSG